MEIRCASCQTTLRVADEHAGRQARCPKCGNIQTVGGDTPNDPRDTTSQPEAASPGPNPLYDSQAGDRPLYDGADDDPSPYRSAIEDSQTYHPDEIDRGSFRAAHGTPHRGSLVLICSILGLLCTCPVLSIAAWVMASKDLTAMSNGLMDPEGRDSTRIGFYLGLIGSILWIALSFCVSIGLLLSSGN